MGMHKDQVRTKEGILFPRGGTLILDSRWGGAQRLGEDQRGNCSSERGRTQTQVDANGVITWLRLG